MDIVPEKVELINSKKSPIQDEYIEKYLAEKELDLTATLDAKEAYFDADFAEALGDTGRILVRESGTEPVVRVMVEAPDHDTCQKYVDEPAGNPSGKRLCQGEDRHQHHRRCL